MADTPYRFTSGERLPVEVLVFDVDPAHLDEFLRVDHEVWTLGEALLPGFERIPFLSKEVWVDDAHPGRVHLVFVWESIAAWERVGDTEIQRRLQAEFDERFTHPVTLVAALHEDSNFGIHRVSRFERPDRP
ncbi:MAG: TIGR03792 family protein [Ilumatobacter fluminis]|uniref:TIGR03792 family protein n=1 Tax=Ilumatobacter fluminis TaxID=467091 RepID=UPI0032EE8A99